VLKRPWRMGAGSGTQRLRKRVGEDDVKVAIGRGQ